MKKILIIADKFFGSNTSADEIGKRIEELGGTCLYLRLQDLANKHTSLSVSYDEGHQQLIYKKDAERIDLRSDVKSVLFWRPKLPDEMKEKIEGKDRGFYYQEWISFLKGIYLCLKDRFWMNPFPWNTVLEEKLFQLKTAQEIGFTIPQSFITTSLTEAALYFKSVSDDVVYKPFSQMFWEDKKGDSQIDTYQLYTSIIKKDDLDNEPDHVTPNIFQVYIPKKIELRITCVGTAVMACEIHSQQSEISKHDWRKYDLDNTPYKKHDLPPDIEQFCLQFLKRLGLTYGCIDMIVTPNDEYVFLELNPNGQFGWIEHMTGLPITENIARMLIKGSINYDMKKW